MTLVFIGSYSAVIDMKKGWMDGREEVWMAGDELATLCCTSSFVLHNKLNLLIQPPSYIR